MELFARERSGCIARARAAPSLSPSHPAAAAMKLQVVDRKGKVLVDGGLYLASYQGAPTVNDLVQVRSREGAVARG